MRKPSQKYNMVDADKVIVFCGTRSKLLSNFGLTDFSTVFIILCFFLSHLFSFLFFFFHSFLEMANSRSVIQWYTDKLTESLNH